MYPDEFFTETMRDNTRIFFYFTTKKPLIKITLTHFAWTYVELRCRIANEHRPITNFLKQKDKRRFRY